MHSILVKSAFWMQDNYSPWHANDETFHNMTVTKQTDSTQDFKASVIMQLHWRCGTPFMFPFRQIFHSSCFCKSCPTAGKWTVQRACFQWLQTSLLAQNTRMLFVSCTRLLCAEAMLDSSFSLHHLIIHRLGITIESLRLSSASTLDESASTVDIGHLLLTLRCTESFAMVPIVHHTIIISGCTEQPLTCWCAAKKLLAHSGCTAHSQQTPLTDQLSSMLTASVSVRLRSPRTELNLNNLTTSSRSLQSWGRQAVKIRTH